MVVAVRVSPPVKGKVPKLNMLELVSVANNRYKISKLRKRLVPEGYCYVCSRINPSGVISKSNGYLFKTGFLHTCEHFPKAPYTTFVQEEIPIQDDDGGDSLVDFAIDKTATISVTIRRGSRSTGHPSPPKSEEKFKSSLGNSESDQQSYTENETKNKDAYFSAEKFRLPSLADATDGVFSARSEPNKPTGRKPNRYRKPSGAQTGFARKSLFNTGFVQTGSERNSVKDFVNTKETGAHQVSVRSYLNEDVFSTKSARDSDFDSLYKQSATSVTTRARLPDTHGLFINKSDGLENALSLQPLIREEIMITDKREPARQLKARFMHERKLREKHAPSEHSASTHRPDSAHLRYHHRVIEDSVPDPGFEIPPTPDDTIGNGTQLIIEQGNDNVTNKSDPNDTSASNASRRKGGHVNENDSDKTTKSAPLSGVSFDKKSFCRCATDMREVSFSRDICKTCGKDCKFRNNLSRGSSLTYSQAGDTNSIASRSGHFRPTRLLMSDNELAMYGKNARTTAAKNGHYSNRNFTFNEEDDQYWSSDEEFLDFEQSPVSWLRNNKPYPVINPDIHKEAYLAALQAARLKGKQNLEDFEIDELKMLRRPNVFSYIPLLPYKDRNKVKYIGIRPDNSSKPKKGQFMKHIFGDVQLDDFYPKFRPKRGEKIKMEDSANNSDQDETPFTNSQDQELPNGPERSSVSLKLKSRNK